MVSARLRNIGIRYLFNAVVVYVVLFFVMFDIRQSAGIYDEDYRYDANLGRSMPVAAGPLPRWIFSPPTYYGLYYGGDEFIFQLYHPFCVAWRMINGYDAPN